MTHRVDSAELASRRRVTGDGHRRRRRWLTGGDGGRRRRQKAEHGDSDGVPVVVWRRRRFLAAARVTHARTEAKLPDALAASSGLRLRRGRWLRLRLDERNTMVALHARDSQRLRRYGRYTERTKTKLKRRRFPTILSCG